MTQTPYDDGDDRWDVQFRCDGCGAVEKRATWWEIEGSGRHYRDRWAATDAAYAVGSGPTIYRMTAVPGRRSIVTALDVVTGEWWQRVGRDEAVCSAPYAGRCA
jgi:hypothetical protein